MSTVINRGVEKSVRSRMKTASLICVKRVSDLYEGQKMISDETKMKIQYLHRQGLSNRAIAADPEIHLSRNTVDKYVNEYEEQQVINFGYKTAEPMDSEMPATKDGDEALKSEIRELELEVEYLRQEIEFLKKIMAVRPNDAAFKVPDSPMDHMDSDAPKK